MTIDSIEDLREHLQWAIQVELATIPTYLYSMYSIEDAHGVPYGLVRSVAVEEMLHAALVANVLTAVGGRPRFYDESVVPSYPMALPHHEPEIVLQLEECTTDVVERVFVEIEKPKSAEALPQDDGYATIEQFYLAIEEAIERPGGPARFDPESATRQLADPRYYAPVEYDAEDSGGLFPVVDVDSACEAIDIIIDQGEGFRPDHMYADPAHEEMTHYYKFKRLVDGTYDLGATRPVVTNPDPASFPPSLRPVADLFDASYSYLFVLMDAIYSPLDQATRDGLVWSLYGVMAQVLRPLARYLTRQPLGDGTGKHAGPPFGFYRFDPEGDPRDELRALSTAVGERHDELDGIDKVIRSLEALPEA
ncbi:ferritin-like domain-containing protein [Halomarina rubra]|uniref:Ferritin-like protein n=1 Tax=Halomarina rubra TaxID=2071873 RepID=A0ABD6ASZ9_9EURY|nr:ferritin-like protein [Halomarina rubra]